MKVIPFPTCKTAWHGRRGQRNGDTNRLTIVTNKTQKNQSLESLKDTENRNVKEDMNIEVTK